jgi:MFS family permease
LYFSLGWRWIFIIVAFIGATFLLPVFLFLPETLSAAFTPKALRKRRPNPFYTFPFLVKPFIFTVVFEGVVAMIASFSIPATLPRLYMEKYGLNAAGTGLVLMSTGIGSIIGSILGGQLTDRQFRRYKAFRGDFAVSEDRLRSNYSGLVTVPAGLLIYGWCTQFTVNLAAPVIGLGLIGFGSLIISTATNSYLLDCFSAQAASIIAMVNFVRYSFGCWIPIVSADAEFAMGVGWFYTMFAGLNILAAFGLLWTIARGTRARAKVKPWSEKEEVAKQLVALEATGEGLIMRSRSREAEDDLKEAEITGDVKEVVLK